MRACPHCGFAATEESRTCPVCGSPLTPPDPADARALPPWEDPSRPFPENLIATWRESLFEPATFFARIVETTPLARPLLYFLAVTVIGAFFTLWWELLGVWPGGWQDGGDGAPLPEGVPALLSFFASPFAGLVGLAIWTSILHLFVLLLATEHRGIGATARLLCYAGGPTVLTLVPFLGPLVGLVWIVVLQVVGVRQVHRTTTGRAVAAVLVPALTILALLTVLVMLLVFAGITLLESYA